MSRVEVGAWKEGTLGLRAECDVDSAPEVGINPVPSVGGVTGSAIDPSFILDLHVYTDMMFCTTLAALSSRSVLSADMCHS